MLSHIKPGDHGDMDKGLIDGRSQAEERAEALQLLPASGFFGRDKTLQDKCKRLSKIITALGNFSVQYNFQAVAVALLMMSTSVCTVTDDKCREGEQAAWVGGTASASVFLGAFSGQLTMGYIGDLVGRNMAMCITLATAAFGALASALFAQGSPSDVYSVIIASRFILGVGAGGVFPLSAVKSAEDSGHAVAGGGKGVGRDYVVNPVAAGKAFFWQAPGAMGPWLVGLLLTYDSSMSIESKWRFLMGIGALPSTLIVLLTVREMRMREEVARLDLEAKGLDVPQGVGASAVLERHSLLQHQDIDSIIDVDPVKPSSDDDEVPVPVPVRSTSTALMRRRAEVMLQDPTYRWQLFVCSSTWFFYDIAFYGVALFGGDIVNDMKSGDDDNVSSAESLRYATTMELIALSMGIPASVVTVYAIYYYGSKAVQVWGFAFQAAAFFAMAAAYYPLQKSSPHSLFAIYCVLLFSLNAGPSMTTYCLPAETFPYEIRSTFSGVAAASGKFGAAVGAYMVGDALDAAALHVLLLL